MYSRKQTLRFALLLGAGLVPMNADASLTAVNGDFETGAGSGVQDVVGWFDSTGYYNSWYDQGNSGGTSALGLGRENAAFGWAYQSLGVYNAVDGTMLAFSVDQMVFSDGNSSARLQMNFYAGAFGGAADGTDIVGNVSEIFGQTFNSMNEDGFSNGASGTGDVRTVGNTVDLSGLADGTEVWVRIGNGGLGGGSGYGPVDNFSIVQSGVPEPGSLALLGLGALAIVRRRRGN